MEITATAKFIRMSPTKLRLIADLIRKESPSRAVVTLASQPQLAAVPLSRAISSAIANAKQKNIEEAALRFAHIDIGEGPVMKRWHAASRGQAHPYKKRMTHIRIVLSDEKEKKS